MSLHPESTARLTILAKVGVLVAGALAAALWVFFQWPGPETPETSAPPPVTRTAARSSSPPVTPPPVHTDWAVLDGLLAWASPPLSGPVGGQSPGPGGKGQDLTGKPVDDPGTLSPPPTALAWRFVGYVDQGDSRIALMTIEGRQRFLTTGQVQNGFKVESVATDHVAVSQGGVTHRIELVAPPVPDPTLAAPAIRQTSPVVRPNRLPVRPNPGRDPRSDDRGAAERAAALERERALDLERQKERAREQSGERPQR